VGQTCFACGQETDGAPKTCPECKSPFLIECPKCEAAFEPGATTCPSCGIDLLAETRAELERERSESRPLKSETATQVFFRIIAVVAVMAGLFWLVERLDWSGPESLIGMGAILAVMSLTVVYVLYSPFFGSTGKKRRIRPRRGGRFAEVYRTLNLPRARHLKSLLDSEGIPTFIYNENATTLDPFDPFTGIRVMVPSDKLEEVTALMPAFGFETDMLEEPE
jgi:Putative prokaryotic signal transducing protein/Double zinc ribbon